MVRFARRSRMQVQPITSWRSISGSRDICILSSAVICMYIHDNSGRLGPSAGSRPLSWIGNRWENSPICKIDVKSNYLYMQLILHVDTYKFAKGERHGQQGVDRLEHSFELLRIRQGGPALYLAAAAGSAPGRCVERAGHASHVPFHRLW